MRTAAGVSPDALTPDQRERLGRQWVATGLGEHASVAAFARFVLDLLSLGAPPHLVLDAIRAMEDEVEHARLCFGIARELIGEAGSPGRLDLSHVFDQRDDPGSILTSAILEGCFDETVSAACARVAYERVEEPRIRSALARIANDESRHADLSWRFVSWMLEVYPELRGTAQACFARMLAASDEPAEDEEGAPFESYGHLLASSRKQVKDATLRDVIGPRVAALLGHGAHAAAP